MQTSIPLLVAVIPLATFGCRKKEVAPPPEPATPQGSPELVCPPESVPVGYPPPTATAVWCAKPGPDGDPVRHGPAITWFTDGTRASEGSYADGIKDGPWVTFHENGAPESQGAYVAGKREGTWSTYHPSGANASVGDYLADQPEGRWVFWDIDAQWRSEGVYVKGARDGVWTEYGPDSSGQGERPVNERVYRSGRLVTVREL